MNLIVELLCLNCVCECECSCSCLCIRKCLMWLRIDVNSFLFDLFWFLFYFHLILFCCCCFFLSLSRVCVCVLFITSRILCLRGKITKPYAFCFRFECLPIEGWKYLFGDYANENNVWDECNLCDDQTNKRIQFW